jgi:hypothetical protein
MPSRLPPASLRTYSAAPYPPAGMLSSRVHGLRSLPRSPVDIVLVGPTLAQLLCNLQLERGAGC